MSHPVLPYLLHDFVIASILRKPPNADTLITSFSIIIHFASCNKLHGRCLTFVLQTLLHNRQTRTVDLYVPLNGLGQSLQLDLSAPCSRLLDFVTVFLKKLSRILSFILLILQAQPSLFLKTLNGNVPPILLLGTFMRHTLCPAWSLKADPCKLKGAFCLECESAKLRILIERLISY